MPRALCAVSVSERTGSEWNTLFEPDAALARLLALVLRSPVSVLRDPNSSVAGSSSSLIPSRDVTETLTPFPALVRARFKLLGRNNDFLLCDFWWKSITRSFTTTSSGLQLAPVALRSSGSCRRLGRPALVSRVDSCATGCKSACDCSSLLDFRWICSNLALTRAKSSCIRVRQV